MPRHSRDRSAAQHSTRYGFAMLAVAVGCWLEVLVSGPAPLLVFVPLSLAVATSAVYGGFRGGAMALLLSIPAADMFVLDPGRWLSLGGSDSAVTFAMYLAAWLVFCVFAERGYRTVAR